MKLDAYEFTSIVVPGALLIFISLLLFPNLAALLGKDGIELGGLGLVLILSLATGQVVQAIGNIIRKLDYILGIDPSDSLLSEDQRFLEKGQWIRLAKALNENLNVDLQKLSGRDWASIRTEMRAIIRAAESDTRLSTLTRNAGQARGIVAACLLGIPLVLLSHIPSDSILPSISILTICAILAYFRMRRALNFYLKHLVLEYINIATKT